jgi:hypothetical protein
MDVLARPNNRFDTSGKSPAQCQRRATFQAAQGRCQTGKGGTI